MNVPQRKVESLMVSPVPQLHGNFPLSVTLALQALTLQGAATHDSEVANDMLRLLQKPFYASEDPSLGQKMKHLFSFALVYLRQQNMLNGVGQACGFAGMATHLFWSEPSNYGFATLLRKRVFHTICERTAGLRAAQETGGAVPETLAVEMLQIMSHLFERVRLVRSAAQDAELQQATSRSVTHTVAPSAAWCNTWLLIKLPPKGILFSFLFLTLSPEYPSRINFVRVVVTKSVAANAALLSVLQPDSAHGMAYYDSGVLNVTSPLNFRDVLILG